MVEVVFRKNLHINYTCGLKNGRTCSTKRGKKWFLRFAVLSKAGFKFVIVKCSSLQKNWDFRAEKWKFIAQADLFFQCRTTVESCKHGKCWFFWQLFWIFSDYLYDVKSVVHQWMWFLSSFLCCRESLFFITRKEK